MWLHTDFHCFWNSELMTSIMWIHDGEVMYFWSDIDFLEGIVVKIHIHWNSKGKIDTRLPREMMLHVWFLSFIISIQDKV